MLAKALLYAFPLPLRIMFTDSAQYATVLTPSHIPNIADSYQILCPPLEQNIHGHSSLRPFRVRPPSKSNVVGKFKIPQDPGTFSMINNYQPESISPEIEKLVEQNNNVSLIVMSYRIIALGDYLQIQNMIFTRTERRVHLRPILIPNRILAAHLTRNRFLLMVHTATYLSLESLT